MSNPDEHIPAWGEGLDLRERLFIMEYLADPALRVMPALIRAGYSPGASRGLCTRIFHRPQIVRAVALAMKDRTDSLDISAKLVLSEAFRCYLLAMDKGKLTDARHFLKMIGDHSDIAAFVHHKTGGLGLDPNDEEETRALERLSDEELKEYDRLTRKLSGVGAQAAADPSQLN